MGMGTHPWPLYDGMGRLVPERARKPFIYRKRASGLCHRIMLDVHNLTASLEQSEYGQQVDTDKVRIALIKALNEVMDNVPVTECPEDPHPPGCAVCGGKRWLSHKELDARLFTSQET